MLGCIATMLAVPTTMFVPYEKFSCAYGVGTTPVCENVSRSSGTCGGACSTSLLCPGLASSRLLKPTRSGAVNMP